MGTRPWGGTKANARSPLDSDGPCVPFPSRTPSTTVLASLGVAATCAALGSVYRGRIPLGILGPYLVAAAPIVKPLGLLSLGAWAALPNASHGTRLLALTGGTAAVAAAQLTRVHPRGTRTTGLTRQRDENSVRLYIHNILHENSDGGLRIAQQIHTADPDIVVLLEASHEATANLYPALRSRYAHVETWKTEDTDGYVIASRFSLSMSSLIAPESTRPALALRVDSTAFPFSLVAMHLNAPHNPRGLTLWAREHRAHARALNDSFNEHAPLVVVGDFNATKHHQPFRQFLKKTGLRDTTGSHPTWPSGRPHPPVYGLDHALLRGPVVARGWITLPGRGSDHRALVVDVGPASGLTPSPLGER